MEILQALKYGVTMPPLITIAENAIDALPKKSNDIISVPLKAVPSHMGKERGQVGRSEGSLSQHIKMKHKEYAELYFMKRPNCVGSSHPSPALGPALESAPAIGTQENLVPIVKSEGKKS